MKNRTHFNHIFLNILHTIKLPTHQEASYLPSVELINKFSTSFCLPSTLLLISPRSFHYSHRDCNDKIFIAPQCSC